MGERSERVASAAVALALFAASAAWAQEPAPATPPPPPPAPAADAPVAEDGVAELLAPGEPLDPAEVAAQRTAGIVGIVGWAVLGVALALYFRYRWHRKKR